MAAREKVTPALLLSPRQLPRTHRTNSPGCLENPVPQQSSPSVTQESAKSLRHHQIIRRCSRSGILGLPTHACILSRAQAAKRTRHRIGSYVRKQLETITDANEWNCKRSGYCSKFLHFLMRADSPCESDDSEGFRSPRRNSKPHAPTVAQHEPPPTTVAPRAA